MKSIILAMILGMIGIVEMAAQKTTTTVTTTETTTTYNGTDSTVVTRTTTTTTVSEPTASHNTSPTAKREITQEEMKQMVNTFAQMADTVETIVNDMAGLGLQMISQYAQDLQKQTERIKESSKPTMDALFDVLDASLQQMRAYSDSLMTNKKSK